MHRLILAATPAAGFRNLDIARFINETRPFCKSSGITGLMILEGGTMHILLEGPETALKEITARTRNSPLFTAAEPAGSMPIRFRALDKICLACTKPENLPADMRREIAMLTGLEFQPQALAA